jgi:hypothetical protein
MPPINCTSCMDAGFVIWDGVPRECGNCDAGRDWAQRGGRAPRAEMDPRRLPPGGDVLLTEAKRQAAGLPPGVIGGEVMVRATLEVEPLVHELVRTLDDCTRDIPGASERAVELLGGLPEWAIPDDVRNRDQERAGSDDERELTLVGSASGKSSRQRRRRQESSSAGNPAAPLEPPAAE